MKSLKLVQDFTSLIFSTFLILHLTSLLFSFGGPSSYNWILSVFRQYYQSPFVEPLILISGLVHGFISFYRYTIKPLPTTTTLHRWSGFVIFVVYLGHVSATRVLPFIENVKTGFHSISFTLDTFPYIFYPYYFVFGVCGLIHLNFGLLKLLQKLTISNNIIWKSFILGYIGIIAASLYTFGTHNERRLGNHYNTTLQMYLKYPVFHFFFRGVNLSNYL